MYLVKQQHVDDSFGDTQFMTAGAVGNDVAIEDEQRPETNGDQARLSGRDQEMQTQQHQSAQRLTRDVNYDDDDDDFPAASNGGGTSSRVIVIGWDSFRSRLMLFLIACLIIWACIFFPLLDT